MAWVAAPVAEPSTALLVALGIIFLAEFGDKTQFAVLAMAGRGHPWRVFAGAALAFALLSVAAAWLGDLVGDRLPLQWVAVAAGLVFTALGVLALRRDEEDGSDDRRMRGRPGLVAAFLLIFLAEFGDRTQIAIVALAARNGHPWLTGLGALIGLLGATAVAVVVGKVLQERLPREKIEKAAAILFILVGVSFLTAPWWPW